MVKKLHFPLSVRSGSGSGRVCPALVDQNNNNPSDTELLGSLTASGLGGEMVFRATQRSVVEWRGITGGITV